MFEIKYAGFEGLCQRLKEYENKYGGMTSAEFFERFERGELGDGDDFILWSGLYKFYLEMSSERQETPAGETAIE